MYLFQMVPVRNFRYETVVSGPPRTPISTAEKIVHFSVICVAFFATPGTLRTNAVFHTLYFSKKYINPYLVLLVDLKKNKAKRLANQQRSNVDFALASVYCFSLRATKAVATTRKELQWWVNSGGTAIKINKAEFIKILVSRFFQLYKVSIRIVSRVPV